METVESFLAGHFDIQYITSIPFIYLYYVYNICVSKLVDPGRFPSPTREAIHHTTFFIKLIFFKKSHLRYLERLLSLATRKSTREERKIHLALEDKMDMKIFMLKMIYVRLPGRTADMTQLSSFFFLLSFCLFLFLSQGIYPTETVRI